MKKIFTDCDIYEDSWYRDLPTKYKLFWDYICRMCEFGLWKPDFKLAQFLLGIKFDSTEAFEFMNKEKVRVEKAKDGRWFIVDFCHFQYGGLTETCPAHKPIFSFYRSFYPDLLNRVLSRVSNTLQEKKQQEIIRTNKKTFNDEPKKYCHDCERYFDGIAMFEKHLQSCKARVIA